MSVLRAAGAGPMGAQKMGGPKGGGLKDGGPKGEGPKGGGPKGCRPRKREGLQAAEAHTTGPQRSPNSQFGWSTAATRGHNSTRRLPMRVNKNDNGTGEGKNRAKFWAARRRGGPGERREEEGCAGEGEPTLFVASARRP